MAIRLTKAEAEALADNIEKNGGDASDLRNIIKPTTTVMTEEDYVKFKMRQASRSEGVCSICGAQGSLYSDTCEKCFREWMLTTYPKGRRK